MKTPKESTLIVCGIVRDAEKGLRCNIPVINALLKEFEDYRVFIYENDSIDNTKQLLKDWHEIAPQRIHISLNQREADKTIPSSKHVEGVNPFFSHKRIDKMAHIRNKYMEYIDKQGWEADYLMVVDLDVAKIELAPILTSFNSNREWDAVCAFGYSTSPKFKRRYHDTYALTLWEEKDEPQTEEKIKRYADQLGSLTPTDEWVRIASGFGGLSIYRYEAVKGLRYTEPAISNADKRVEVKCEHFSLYKQMMERGYDHFYINPAMILKYQHLTWNIVWNSLCRILGFK